MKAQLLACVCTFREINGDGERLADGSLKFPKVPRFAGVFGELFPRRSLREEGVATHGTSARGRATALPARGTRRRRLSRRAVISSELSPRGDDAVVVHGAGTALYRGVALCPRRLETVYLPAVLENPPGFLSEQLRVLNEPIPDRVLASIGLATIR